jgi:hypothetical protein
MMNGFSFRNLSVLTYANGYTHWHYKASGSMSETLNIDFFKNCIDLLRDQDTVMINAIDGSCVAVFSSHKGIISCIAMQQIGVPRS